MFKKSIALLVCVGMLLSFGCASIQKGSSCNGLALTAEGKTNVGHYNASNWGIYLLSIPLLTGDTEKEFKLSEEGVTTSIAFMKDTVNVDRVEEMLTRAAKDDGATIVEDMTSSRKSVWFAPLLVIFIKSVQISANGVK